MLADAIEAAAKGIEDAGGALVHQVRFRPLEREARVSGGGRRNQAKEAFGFADGVSQPIIKGTRRWLKEADAIHIVEAGEFLLGYPDNRGGHAFSPLVRSEEDPLNLLPVVDPVYARAHYPSLDQSGANRDRDLGRNGSYLVIRQLAQDVEAFDQSVAQAARQCAGHPGMPPDLEPWQREQWVAAKMVGRWRDGTSLVRYPHRPGTGWSEKPDVDPGKDGPIDIEPDNGFLLGAEDPIGHRCPFGSHIRRSNPRETMTPGSMQQLAITNRHRILRVGRRYSAYEHAGKAEKEGLFFMCLNSELERQFEFIQQTWSFAIAVHGRRERGRRDPRARRAGGGQARAHGGPAHHSDRNGPDLRPQLARRDPGPRRRLFFLPSRSALAWLSS